MVHCAETNAAGRENGLCESLGWWYRRLAEFTIHWEFPNLDPPTEEAAFPR